MLCKILCTFWQDLCKHLFFLVVVSCFEHVEYIIYTGELLDVVSQYLVYFVKQHTKIMVVLYWYGAQMLTSNIILYSVYEWNNNYKYFFHIHWNKINYLKEFLEGRKTGSSGNEGSRVHWHSFVHHFLVNFNLLCAHSTSICFVIEVNYENRKPSTKMCTQITDISNNSGVTYDHNNL